MPRKQGSGTVEIEYGDCSTEVRVSDVDDTCTAWLMIDASVEQIPDLAKGEETVVAGETAEVTVVDRPTPEQPEATVLPDDQLANADNLQQRAAEMGLNEAEKR